MIFLSKGTYSADKTCALYLTYLLGRMIPSTPWETPFRGIARWLGIKESRMLEVCPNLNHFNSTYLVEPWTMFETIEEPGPSPEPSPAPIKQASLSPSLSPSKSPWPTTSPTSETLKTRV